MIFDPCLEWLGFRTRRPVAGLHVTAHHLTLVALRPHPLRLVVVARGSVPEAAVVDGDIRLERPLMELARLLVERSHLASGTPTVAVIEPRSDTLSVAVDGPGEATCEATGWAHDRIVDVVTGAGLTVWGVDTVPAALARLALLDGVDARAGETAPPARSDSHGWEVVVAGARLEAKRSTGAPGPQAKGSATRPTEWDTGHPLTVPQLSGIKMSPRLRPLVDPALDAVAIGGALAALDRHPRIGTRPVATASDADWTVQPVGR